MNDGDDDDDDDGASLAFRSILCSRKLLGK